MSLSGNIFESPQKLGRKATKKSANETWKF